MKKLLTILSFLSFYMLPAQEAEQVIKKGNDLYKQKQYEPAKTAYEEALTKDPSSTVAKFNLANTTYRLAKPDDAIKSFDELANNSNEAADKSKAWYNKGAILSNQKKLEESIEAYKNALRQNPDDKEARENLQKALLELKKKTPPPPPKKENEKKKQQNKKQPQQPKMNPKEAEQKLKLLQQKEKELQQRMQKKSKNESGGPNDW